MLIFLTLIFQRYSVLNMSEEGKYEVVIIYKYPSFPSLLSFVFFLSCHQMYTHTHTHTHTHTPKEKGIKNNYVRFKYIQLVGEVDLRKKTYENVLMLLLLLTS